MCNILHLSQNTINNGVDGTGRPSAEMFATSSSNTSKTNAKPFDIKIPNRSSSLELILTPIIQSRR